MLVGSSYQVAARLWLHEGYKFTSRVVVDTGSAVSFIRQELLPDGTEVSPCISGAAREVLQNRGRRGMCARGHRCGEENPQSLIIAFNWLPSNGHRLARPANSLRRKLGRSGGGLCLAQRGVLARHRECARALRPT